MYRALAPGEIRLLEILPTPKSCLAALIDKIECNLIHARLNGDIEYEALSYCWGKPKSKKADLVIVNSARTTFQVTEALHAALQQLRRTDKRRLIWVDSISINQMDHDEKAEQVSRMTNIYKGAKQVLGWLGPATTTEESVILMNQFSKGLGEKNTLPNPAWTTDFESFLGNAYFSRLWIIQEVAVAKKLLLFFGRYELLWEDFCHLLESFLGHFGIVLNTTSADIGLERIMILISTRNMVTEHVYQNKRSLRSLDAYRMTRLDSLRDLPGFQTGDFPRLICQSRTFGASDPRDRVFALAGLVHEEGKRMVINYDPLNTADRVYGDFTLLTILHTQRLDILSQAGLSEYDLPSWVPDLTRRLPHTPLDARRYSANAEPSNYKKTLESNALIVSGYKIGTVRRLVDGLGNHDTAFQDLACSLPWQPAVSILPEKPRLLEREISTTFELIGTLFCYNESRTQGAFKTYKNLARSIQTAVSALYDGFTKTTPRISIAMENTWHDSAMSTGKVSYAIPAYDEMLIGSSSIAGLPVEIVSKHKHFLANTWRNHVRDQPFKPVLASSYTIPDVPDELKEVILEVEKRGGANDTSTSARHARHEGLESQSETPIYFSGDTGSREHLNSPCTGRTSSSSEGEQQHHHTSQSTRQQLTNTASSINEQSEHHDEHTNPVPDDESIFWTLHRAIKRQIERLSHKRKFATTDRELGMAWVPQSTHEQDEIWILVGASVPFVLRPVIGRKGMFRLVGDAYHYGVMQGEYFTGEYQAKYTRWIDGPAEFGQKEEVTLI